MRTVQNYNRDKRDNAGQNAGQSRVVIYVGQGTMNSSPVPHRTTSLDSDLGQRKKLSRFKATMPTVEGVLILEAVARRKRAAARLSADSTRAARSDQPPTAGPFTAPAADRQAVPDALPVCCADTCRDTSLTPDAPQNRT
jgi:hypothetical protein